MAARGKTNRNKPNHIEPNRFKSNHMTIKSDQINSRRTRTENQRVEKRRNQRDGDHGDVLADEVPARMAPELTRGAPGGAPGRTHAMECRGCDSPDASRQYCTCTGRACRVWRGSPPEPRTPHAQQRSCLVVAEDTHHRRDSCACRGESRSVAHTPLTSRAAHRTTRPQSKSSRRGSGSGRRWP